MKYKYTEIQASWGISITLEMVEEKITEPDFADTKIDEFLYLKSTVPMAQMPAGNITWIVKGFKDLAIQIYDKVNQLPIRYEIISLEHALTDFQPEGLYCVTQGWIGAYYDIKAPKVEVYFDKKCNKYIFPGIEIT